MDIAASTTATGRKLLLYAKKVIEEVYGDYEINIEDHGKVKTKAEYIAKNNNKALIIGADQAVRCDRKILGKHINERISNHLNPRCLVFKHGNHINVRISNHQNSHHLVYIQIDLKN